jgi:non-ribosomal peptide synthase protein (TIGR01720 family)
VASARELNRQLRRVPHGGTGFGILKYLSRDPDVVAHMRRALAPQVFLNYFGPDSSRELGRLAKVETYGGFHRDRGARRLCPLSVGIMGVGEKLLIKCEYSVNLHRTETIQRLAQRSRDVLLWFVENCRHRGGGTAAPAG